MLFVFLLIFLASSADAVTDSTTVIATVAPAVEIDSALYLLNAGKPEAALSQLQTLNLLALPDSLKRRTARLGMAGLRAQPGNHAWIRWISRFEKFDDGIWPSEQRLWAAREALNAGLPQTAATLLNNFPAPQGSAPLRHAWEILQARLEASAGRLQDAETRLDAWKNNPDRREGSGEVLFWQGWAALQAHRRNAADTLFLLSSAYVDEDASQLALEYRYALLLDTSEMLYAYSRGLPESPLPDSARETSLEGVSPASPLHPGSLWERAKISERSGDKAAEISVLQELAKDLSSLPGRRAAVELAWVRFEPSDPDSAMAAYEQLLLQYQQGVPSEFARSRVQALRADTAAPVPKSSH